MSHMFCWHSLDKFVTIMGGKNWSCFEQLFNHCRYWCCCCRSRYIRLTTSSFFFSFFFEVYSVTPFSVPQCQQGLLCFPLSLFLDLWRLAKPGSSPLASHQNLAHSHHPFFYSCEILPAAPLTSENPHNYWVMNQTRTKTTRRCNTKYGTWHHWDWWGG